MSLRKRYLGLRYGNPEAYNVRDSVSVLEHSRDVNQNNYFNLNVILVGWEVFDEAEREQISGAIHVARQLLTQVDVGLGRVVWYDNISVHDHPIVGGVVSRLFAEKITNLYYAGNDGLDVFFFKSVEGVLGFSAHGGPCDKRVRREEQTAVVVSLDHAHESTAERTVTSIGVTIVHEALHYMGLETSENGNDFHSLIQGNVLVSGATSGTTEITRTQADTARRHCLMNDPCRR